MHGQGFERFVEGEAVRAATTVWAFGAAGRHFFFRGVDYTLNGLLGVVQFFRTEGVGQMNVPGYVEEVSLFGIHGVASS